MILDDFRTSAEAGLHQISCRVRPEHAEVEEFRLWFRFPEEYAPGGELDASPFLPPALAWCLRNAERLVIEGPVSTRLLGELDEIMAVYQSFYSGAIRGPVEVQADAHEPAPGREVTASLFTRGLDSWFAVLTALDDPDLRPPITHVIFSPDHLSENWGPEVREAHTRGVREAAARVGLQMVRFDSNVTDFFGRGQFSMALAVGFRNVLIASGDMRGGIRRKGSHPYLDPRFSTERTEIIHWGDASRIQKAARVAQSPDALETLRVCQYDQLTSDLNCGRCEKCLRTMVELHSLGALVRAPVFAQPLKVSNVLAVVKDIKNSRPAWLEAQNALGDNEFDRQLAAAIRMVIFRSDLRFAARRARLLSEREDLEQALGGDHVLAETADRLREIDREVERRMQVLNGEVGAQDAVEDERSSKADGRRRRLGRLLSRR
jgi:hypothetical protein